MAPASEETALYVGEGGNYLTDGTPLIPGKTVALVSKGEAEGSDLWKPTTKAKPASKRPRNSPPATAPTPPVPPQDEAA